MITDIGLASREGEYVQVDLNEIDSDKFKDCVVACHCMLYAKRSGQVMGGFNPRASVLMQMRFDGHLGFPGGVVDPGESPVEALLRELQEEMGFGAPAVPKLLAAHYSSPKRLLLLFYTLRLDEDAIKGVERAALDSHDHGDEVLGVLRVPLYTMEDGFRGFPAFLTNRFIGNSKEQLLTGLEAAGILTEAELATAQRAKPAFLPDEKQ